MKTEKETISVLSLGDIVGRAGREAVRQIVAKIKIDQSIDLVIANGENASGGLGLDPKTADEIRSFSVDIITLGDHTWHDKSLGEYLNLNRSWCIRPANYPPTAPGAGSTVFQLKNGPTVGVMNLMGRVFMNSTLDCPFQAADRILETDLANCNVVICDMHAEATSEKMATGRYLDGRVSLVFGTHTHVQTSDEVILPKGTAFISDLGMCGPIDGVIGMDKDVAIKRFVTGMPHGYRLAGGDAIVGGVITKIDINTGKAVEIKRVRENIRLS